MLIWIWILTFLANNTQEMTKHHHTENGLKIIIRLKNMDLAHFLNGNSAQLAKEAKYCHFL